MWHKIFLGSDVNGTWLTSLGWTLIRIFVGLNMALHGFGKLPPSNKFIGFVAEIGLPFATFFAWSAALAEFLGGTFLLIGLFTRPAAFFIFCTMFVAAFGAHRKDPFGEGETALLYGVVALGFGLMGAGGSAWSVDAWLRSFGKQKLGSRLSQSGSISATILLCAISAISVHAQTQNTAQTAKLIAQMINPQQLKETFIYWNQNLLVMVPDSLSNRKIIGAFHTPLNPNPETHLNYDNDILNWNTLRPLEKHTSSDSVIYDYSVEQELKLNPAQLKPATFYRKFGPNNITVELIFPATTSNNQKVWRTIHYLSDPLGSEFASHDMYDVDFNTLRPITSEMNNEGIHNKVEFSANSANFYKLVKSNNKKTQHEVKIPKFVYGEGPALTTLIAALPLKENYSAEFFAVNRFGKGEGTLMRYKVKVVGKEMLKIASGTFETYVVETSNDNFSYKEWVLASPPHYSLKGEFVDLSTKKRFVNEVSSFLIGDK